MFLKKLRIVCCLVKIVDELVVVEVLLVTLFAHFCHHYSVAVDYGVMIRLVWVCFYYLINLLLIFIICYVVVLLSFLLLLGRLLQRNLRVARIEVLHLITSILRCSSL